ncbi:hypothetical protein [Maribacter sp.]|uniref:hypothetical protein n=1 Tax=Maribacter sp. TaxID=1897614 RepID=UPI0032994AA5
MKIESIDETELIFIAKGKITLKVSLDNIRRDYLKNNDKSIISDFAKTLRNYTLEMPNNWAEAKENIFISLYPSDYDYKDFINHKLTDQVHKIYIHRENDMLTWISYNDIDKWNISESILNAQAEKNGDRILAESTIEYDTIENKKLGILESKYSNLKGALLLAPSMKTKIKTDFSFPFYAVIPVRDFCYVFSEQDSLFFSQRIGQVVVEEFRKSGYPLTTELLKFSENGIETVGIYDESE